jgi:hypothetical protein
MAFASVVMPLIGGEPIGPVLVTPTTSDQDALILRILKAVETHDYRTLLIYTLDKETDYFGHRNSSNAFIQQDMTENNIRKCPHKKIWALVTDKQAVMTRSYVADRNCGSI